ncbi:hypothetical protein CVT25_001178 [Psilocybe cyanescens]|uniref:Uncharacterized protein n=1 Tax=Psilocybe cyanescens TaxID=93625 RepID=A0A409XKF4_PSICY|nr:hypothetical protein CVT25_001178 [Psilocybe cyanescens]
MPGPSSVLSSSLSLRPLSMTLTNLHAGLDTLFGSGHSGSYASMRWGEQGLEIVREMKGRMREAATDEDKNKDGEERKKEVCPSRESRRSSGGRRRTALMDVLPEGQVRRSVDGAHDDAEEDDAEDKASASIKRFSDPNPGILTTEEATADEHWGPDDWDDVIAEYESGNAEGDVDSEAAIAHVHIRNRGERRPQDIRGPERCGPRDGRDWADKELAGGGVAMGDVTNVMKGGMDKEKEGGSLEEGPAALNMEDRRRLGGVCSLAMKMTVYRFANRKESQV